MRLLADENFPFPVVEALRSFAFDVLTLNDLGKAGQALTDVAVLKLASDDARALVTLNRKHFIRLHQSSSDHSGIIVCSFDLDFDGQAERIRSALDGRVRSLRSPHAPLDPPGALPGGCTYRSDDS